MPVRMGSKKMCYNAKLIPSDANLNNKYFTNTNAGSGNLYASSAYNGQKELRIQPQTILKLRRIYNIFHTFFAISLLSYFTTQNVLLYQISDAFAAMFQISITLHHKQEKVKIFP